MPVLLVIKQPNQDKTNMIKNKKFNSHQSLLLKILPCVLLFFIAPDIFAGVFDPPPTDKSVALLGNIFGANIGNIYLGGAANPVLSAIMEKFNFIIVVIGTIMVSYIGIVSTVNTAQEGSAMGKKWSTVWIPVRSVAGMALMIPSPASGYSMIQVTVMWIILQGVGAADQLWDITLDGLKSGLSASAGTAKLEDPGIKSNAKALAYQVLNAAICMESMFQAAKEDSNDGEWVGQHGSYIKNFTEKDPTETKTNTMARITGHSYFGVDDSTDPDHKDVCGDILIDASVTRDEYKLPNDILDTYPGAEALYKNALHIYDTKMLAISLMLTIMKPLAEGLVTPSPYNSSKPQINQPDASKMDTAPTPPGYFNAAVDAYISMMSGLAVPMDDSSSSAASNVKIAVDNGKKAGWISAGSFYFILNRTMIPVVFNSAKAAPTYNNMLYCISATDPAASCQTIAYDATESGFSAKKPDYQKFNTRMQTIALPQSEDRKQLALNLARGYVFLKRDENSITGGSSIGIPAAAGNNQDLLAQVMAPVTSAAGDAVKSMMTTMGGASDSDPLMSHAILGRNIMIGCEAALIAIFIISGAISAGVGFMGILLGLSVWLLGLLATLSGFLGTLWAFGATLAVYTPLIPYMIFTVAAVGWMMTVIEAVVAGPIIALGIITPSGDELGKLEHALNLLANIFVRPMLMIFGFLLAGRVYRAIVHLIDFGMADVYNTINLSSIFSPLVAMAVYVTFILSVTNTCFSLIYVIPDKLLRWMGSRGDGGATDMQAVDAAKGAVESAGSEVGKQISDGASATGNKTAKSRQERIDNGEGMGVREYASSGKSNKDIKSDMSRDAADAKAKGMTVGELKDARKAGAARPTTGAAGGGTTGTVETTDDLTDGGDEEDVHDFNEDDVDTDPEPPPPEGSDDGTNV